MKLNLLNNQDIDRLRWDKAVAESSCPLIYATSWYLDVVCPQWKGLILDDYEFIMPMPFFQKWAIPTYLQPLFSQKLAILSSKKITLEVLKIYSSSMFQYPWFLYDIQCDRSLFYPKLWIKQKVRTNIELNLHKPYHILSDRYNTNTHRNIKQAKKNGIYITTSSNNKAIIDAFQSTKNISVDIYLLNRLLDVVKQNATLHIFHALNQEHQFLAGAILFEYANRLYYIFSGTSEQARNTGASHLLIDHIIKLNSEKKCIFDFEGSDQANLQQFYLGFGAEKTMYYRYQSRFKP